MEELVIYKTIEGVKTFKELKAFIETLGEIPGSRREWSSEEINNAIEKIQSTDIDFSSFNGKSDMYGYSIFNFITRTYGLRAKVILLKLYAEDRNL